ncbi:MAG: hypothetical protein V2A54_00145 [Bacteroidota bacterium]
MNSSLYYFSDYSCLRQAGIRHSGSRKYWAEDRMKVVAVAVVVAVAIRGGGSIDLET